jgi:diguanylate cyclase (GGDEF)-like protein
MPQEQSKARYKAGLKRKSRRPSRLGRLLMRAANPRCWSLRARIVYLSGVLLLLGAAILILFLVWVLHGNAERTGTEALRMFQLRVREAVAAEEKRLVVLARSLARRPDVLEAMAAAEQGADQAGKPLAGAAAVKDLADEPGLRVWFVSGRDGAPPESGVEDRPADVFAELARRNALLRGVVETPSGPAVAAGIPPIAQSGTAGLVLTKDLSRVLANLRLPPGYGLGVLSPDGEGLVWRRGRMPKPENPIQWEQGRAGLGSSLLQLVRLQGPWGRPARRVVLAYDTSLLRNASWNRVYQFSWFFISGALLLWAVLFFNVSRVERFLARLREIIIASHANDFAERFESDHVHCLEIMDCHNEECPVHQNPNLVCHLETGSEAISPRWRDTCVFLNVYDTCSNCPVYAIRRGDELNEMRNVVNTMMRLWGQFLSRVGELLSHVLRTQSAAGKAPSLDEVSDRLEQMARLSAFSHDLQGVRDKQEVYSQLAWVFEAHFAISRLVVFEVGADRDSLHLVWDASGEADMAGPELELGPEHCRACRTASDVVSFHNAALCPNFQCDHDREFRCCLPIIMSGRVGAVVSFAASKHSRERISDLLPIIRKHLDECGPVLSSLQLLGLTRDQAQQDPLTRAYNRRFLDEYLRSEAVKPRARGRTGVLMADIDHFKRVNDEFGHEAGDAVLKEVAAIMAEHIRRSDLLVRYGGEEFLVLLQDAAPEAAKRVAENIRQAVEANEFELPSGKIVRKTISIGVCGHPANVPTLSKAITEADAALYQCKRKGRNRVMRCDQSEATARG